MWDLAITAGVSFAAGWFLHWVRSRARRKDLETDCVRKLQAAEEQLAIERLRIERRFREAAPNGASAESPTPATAFELYRETHLARPRSGAPDSPTPRA